MRRTIRQTFVEVQHWSVNHSEDNWADPWKFKPERFLADAEEAREMGNKLEALQPQVLSQTLCLVSAIIVMNNE